MTKQAQMKKNLELSKKLAEFIMKHPNSIKDVPDDASFILFSDDEQLNKQNTILLDNYVSNGKSVVKVEISKDSKTPWKFTPINP